MTYILKLDNKEDFLKIKNFLEQFDGARIFEVEGNYKDGTPFALIQNLSEYANQLTEEEIVSSPSFIENSKEKTCKLYSQKQP